MSPTRNEDDASLSYGEAARVIEALMQGAAKASARAGQVAIRMTCPECGELGWWNLGTGWFSHDGERGASSWQGVVEEWTPGCGWYMGSGLVAEVLLGKWK